ncbi:hypothetical protein AAK899_03815 [Erysipelotrichaceae bacterium 51-3]
MASKNVETSIARGLRTTELQADYDACCKRLLSEKVILAHLLKGIAKEYKGYSVENIKNRYIEGKAVVSKVPEDSDKTPPLITGIDTVHKYEDHEGVLYDILFKSHVPGSKNQIDLIINVEGQKNPESHPQLMRRTVFYVSENIVAQKGRVFTGIHYENIQKVYSIWICKNQAQYRANTINHIYPTCYTQYGSCPEKSSDYDLFDIVLIYLGDEEPPEDAPEIIRLLYVLFSNKMSAAKKGESLEKKFNIRMTQSMEKEINTMCNLGEALAQEIAQKIAQENARSVYLNVLNSICTKSNYSVEQAMELAGIPENERPEYLELLHKQSESEEKK